MAGGFQNNSTQKAMLRKKNKKCIIPGGYAQDCDSDRAPGLLLHHHQGINPQHNTRPGVSTAVLSVVFDGFI